MANIFITLSIQLVRITEPYEYSVFSILRHGQTILQYGCCVLQSHWQWMNIWLPYNTDNISYSLVSIFEVFLKYSSTELHPWPCLLPICQFKIIASVWIHHCGFVRHFPDSSRSWASFCVFISHLSILFTDNLFRFSANFFSVLKIRVGASCVLSKHCTTRLPPQPSLFPDRTTLSYSTF